MLPRRCAGRDPQLGPLAANGGPTDTVSLLAASPGVDNGGACGATDHRGQARPQGGACDIGAFESAFTKPPVATPTPSPAATATPTPAPGPALPVAPADTVAPTVTLRGVPSTIRRAALRKGLKVTVAVNEPASAEVSLLARTRKATLARVGDLVLAQGALKLGSGTRSIRLKVDRRLVAARGRRFTATLVVTASDAAGNRRTVRRTIRVR